MGGLLNAIAQGPAPVQITNPLQRQAQLAEIQNLQGAAGERQINIQKQQREMASQDAIAKAWAAAGGDLDKTVAIAQQQPGVLPEHVVALQQHVLNTKKSIQELDDKALASHIAHSDIAGGQINALLQQPEDQAAQAWPAVVTKLIAEHDVKPEDLKAAGLDPAQYPGHAAAQQFLLGLSGYKQQLSQTLAEREQRAKETTAAAAASNAATNAAKESREAPAANFKLAQEKRAQMIAETAGLENPQLPPAQGQAAYQQLTQKYPELAQQIGPQWNPNAIGMLQRQAVPVEKQPSFDIEKASADAMKNMGPEDWIKEVQGTGAKPGSPLYDSTRAAVENSVKRGDFKSAQQALRDAREELSGTRKAVATVAAEAPIKLAEAAANRGAALDVEKYKIGSAAYNKSGLALASAVTAADDVGKVLDMAGAGNKAAAANVPLVGVGALNAVNGIKRINSAEIAQYGTAGSLLDRIQGKLQGWAEGQPIPKDVLEDMKSLHKQLAEGAHEKHAKEVEVINKTYGQNFKPMEFAKPQAAATGPKVGDTVKVKGKSVKITAIHPDGTFDAQ